MNRIIRSEEADRKAVVRIPSPGDPGSLFVQDQISRVEREAFERGRLEGERSGARRREEILNTAIRRYEKCAAEMATAYQELLTTLEKTTIRLALEVAQKVLRRELGATPGDLEVLVMDALAGIRTQAAITLRVSPIDFDRIHGVISTANPGVTVEEDRTLEAGDFMIHTPLTSMDGRIGSQIEAIGRAMMEA